MLYFAYYKISPILHLIHSCIVFFLWYKDFQKTSKKVIVVFLTEHKKRQLKISTGNLRFETLFQRSLLFLTFVENELEPRLSLTSSIVFHYPPMLVHPLTTLSFIFNSKKFSLVNDCSLEELVFFLKKGL